MTESGNDTQWDPEASLAAKGGTQAETPAPVEPATQITIPTLIENYRAIVRARALYYPVAYQFLQELGRGRQGIVFLGLRQGARGCVTRHAIKLFDPGNYSTPEHYWTDMGRIAVQTSRLQTMQSPNLVARDSYEETYGIGYLQMEAIDGADLRCFLDGSHLDRVRQRSSRDEWARFTDVIFRLDGRRVVIQPGIAIYIMRMMLRGLEALHSMGFVHGDMKPGNTMIDRLGYVKLVDFGRAVSIGEPAAWLLGTPLYMAPEIHRRQPPQIQSDLYSTGLVGLEMLRGQMLTEAGGTEDEMLRFKLRLPDRLPELLPAYVRQNDRFVNTMRRLLHPDPAQRFSTASEADSGPDGLLHVHKQLVHMGKDTEYGRELEQYLSKLVHPLAGSVP
jgi:serine/threonine protein kinase